MDERTLLTFTDGAIILSRVRGTAVDCFYWYSEYIEAEPTAVPRTLYRIIALSVNVINVRSSMLIANGTYICGQSYFVRTAGGVLVL